eukprot:snap_masked-scaffold_16-processed-gene-5.50-mRNA-1 protein AED:1.00 eAED:1.00 QI:0/-1/0/0/-1/1/1/0/306
MDTEEVLAEAKARMDGFFTPKSIELGRTFKPRDDDVFVATAGKCGTTWTLQICHMLRSNGDMDFKDLILETPWDVVAHDVGQDLNDEQKYNPRVFKSHDTYESIAKGGKYIAVTREPKDAFVSLYHFMLTSPIANTSTCSMEAFGKLIYEDSGIFGLPIDHIVSYIEAAKKNPENILFLFYEDMKEKPRENIEKIARFMGLGKLPEEEFNKRCDTAERMSSLEFMKEHKEKFTHKEIMRRALENIPEARKTFEGAGAKLVRSGKTGDGKMIPDVVKELIAKTWKDLIEEKYGYTSYEEFRAKYKYE